MTDKLEVTPENAAKFWEWITKRGGVACWTSLDLSSGGRTVFTPANTEDGKPMGRPHWQYPEKPQRIVTTSFDVIVREGTRAKTVPRAQAQRWVDKLSATASAQGKDSTTWAELRSDGKVNIMTTKRTVPLMDWISEQNALKVLDKVVQP